MKEIMDGTLETMKIKQKLNELMAEHTGKRLAQLEKDTDRDNFMSADDAHKYGLIDQVINSRDSVKA